MQRVESSFIVLRKSKVWCHAISMKNREGFGFDSNKHNKIRKWRNGCHCLFMPASPTFWFGFHCDLKLYLNGSAGLLFLCKGFDATPSPSAASFPLIQKVAFWSVLLFSLSLTKLYSGFSNNNNKHSINLFSMDNYSFSLLVPFLVKLFSDNNNKIFLLNFHKINLFSKDNYNFGLLWFQVKSKELIIFLLVFLEIIIVVFSKL